MIAKLKPRKKNRKPWSKKDKKRLLTDKKLWELAYDLHSETVPPDLFDEATGMLQVQKEFPELQIADIRRPYAGEGTTDFVIMSPLYYRADTKTSVDRWDNGKKIPENVFVERAYKSGQKAITQKNRSEKCLHILNLQDISSPRLKKLYETTFMQAAREANPELAKHIIVINR